MKRLICYGDSNTYGYDAADVFGGRLPAGERWPDLLADSLQCDVINCGMNGRTVPYYPRSRENDLKLIKRSAPCDLVLVMLGTNDILTGRDPQDTADAMHRFLSLLRREIPDTLILLCAPTRVSSIGDAYNDRLYELAEAFRLVAQEMQICYVSAFDWPIPLSSDGVHFSPEGHRVFAAYLKKEFEKEI